VDQALRRPAEGEAPEPLMGSYALLVSTDRYADPTLRQLRSPRADVEALAAVLADPRVQGPGVLLLWLVGEVGPGGMELVWSRHDLPGSCGSHSLMTTVEARACRAIIPDPAGPDRPGPR
jgi:hypothetical protein